MWHGRQRTSHLAISLSSLAREKQARLPMVRDLVAGLRWSNSRFSRLPQSAQPSASL
jgi:hypothetical protein